MKNGAEELYSYDPRNRLTQLTKNGQAHSFEYDNAGNLKKDDKANYFYNEFNQTTKGETFDGNVQINRYDAEGLRYEMEENNRLVQFIFNTNREVVAENSDKTWKNYIRTSELLFSSADHDRTYYHYASDEMGSITHITQGENVLNEYEYDAWGEVVHSVEKVENRFKWGGQQLDPITGQYYLRARFYNPVIARFTQEDTYRGDGLNLYAYCRNNPVYYVDPTGNICQKTADKLYNIFETDGQNLSTKEKQQLISFTREKIRNGCELSSREKDFYDSLSSRDKIYGNINKPSNSPNVKKWVAKGGEISMKEDGTWVYTDWDGNTVSYTNGYPDFIDAGLAIQTVDINSFTNYKKDFKLADELSTQTKLSTSTWHHHQDGKTLVEVNTDIHKRFTHCGGMSITNNGG